MTEVSIARIVSTAVKIEYNEVSAAEAMIETRVETILTLRKREAEQGRVAEWFTALV